MDKIIEKLGARNKISTISFFDMFLPKKAINNSYVIEECKLKLSVLLQDVKKVEYCIDVCNNYAYSLQIPNIEGFKIMYDKIYNMVSCGKSWEEIKELINEH